MTTVAYSTNTEITIMPSNKVEFTNNERRRPVRLNKKRRYASEDRAKYCSTDNPLPYIRRATFLSATTACVRVRAVARARPGHRLVFLRKVDRSRCDRRGEAGVHTG